jgi:hypothetical protein
MEHRPAISYKHSRYRGGNSQERGGGLLGGIRDE